MLCSLPLFWEISAFSHTGKPQVKGSTPSPRSCGAGRFLHPLASHLPQESSDSQAGLGIQVSSTAVRFGNVLL